MHGEALLGFARHSGPYEPGFVLDWLGVRTNASLDDCQVAPRRPPPARRPPAPPPRALARRRALRARAPP